MTTPLLGRYNPRIPVSPARMIGIVSPYELHAQTLGAMTALLLCEHVVTLLPSPLDASSPEDARRAALATPRFGQLVESWRWSAALWKVGVLRSTWAGEQPLEDARNICRRIESDPTLAALAPLVTASRFEQPDAYLESISRDVLRGGGDPGISVPVAAGLERFASRHALSMFTTPAGSLSGRLESRAARPLLRIQLPVLEHADALTILSTRDELAPFIAPIQNLLQNLLQGREALSAGAPLHPLEQALQAAADRYTTAFKALKDRLFLAARSPGQAPIKPAFASLSVVLVEPDASLASAASAAAVLSALRRRPPAATRPADSHAALALPPALAFHIRPLPWDV